MSDIQIDATKPGVNWLDARQPIADTIKAHLAKRSWSQADLADVIGCSPNIISQLVTCRSGISPRYAVKLAAAFPKTTPEYWLGLDRDAELAMVPALPVRAVSAREVINRRRKPKGDAMRATDV